MTDTLTSPEAQKDDETSAADQDAEPATTDTPTASAADSAPATATLSSAAGSGLTAGHFTRYAAELCGTALAVFVTLIAALMAPMMQDLTLTILAAIAAFGAYAVATYVFGRVSGAHLNPAVTLAAALTGRLGWLDALGYLIAQVLGGLIAALLAIPIVSAVGEWYLTRAQASSGQSSESSAKVQTMLWTAMSNGYGSNASHTMSIDLQGAVILEIIASLLIVAVVMRTLDENGSVRKNTALLTGAAYGIGALITSAFTGASLNPVRATGAAIIAAQHGDKLALSQLWVFWVIPLLAGAIVGLILVIAESPATSAPVADASAASAAPSASDDAQSVQAASADADPAADPKQDEKPAVEHKSDEERDIRDFNTVIKQDTADAPADGSADDSPADMNIDYVGKKSEENESDSSDSAASDEK